ncbi:RHS repeat-associated core domain-containing protein [Chryseobacterium taihuense]|uniref:RHS repeat-associated core domain-containing protein n=1 Tax=Chryseobacterium taihuense TaxID=1141221 RepID=A0ABY0R006_9FLAO|nr:RHS repeat-associated core domain-containing protein [Chryseobacterium taihuense]
MYAMDWRQYMPDIGRFAVQDPLSALIPTVTPYRFAINNPIYFSDPSGLLEEVAHCPTCPKTDEFKPYIDDKYNVYVYDSKTNTAFLQVTPIEEVVVTGKKSESNTMLYLDQLNGAIGETGDWLAKNNKGGSIGIWTTPIKNRSFDGIQYNKLNIKYYKDGWKWSKSVKTYGVGNYLKKGSVVGQVVLGAIEIGEGAADDYNDYQTKGETNGKNTVVASTKVATGAAAGYVSGAAAVWFAGAVAGAAGGSLAPGVGTVIGFVVGGVVAYYSSEYAGQAVEQAYK